jgi:alkylation response protein AidB-like acyl-CoA dehydrogenase
MRCTPPRVVEALAAAGLLQMFLPRAIGGRELPPLVAFRAIEEVSKADGSVGWCTMIATVLSLFTGWLDADIAGAGRHAGRSAGRRLSATPGGKLERPTAGTESRDGGTLPAASPMQTVFTASAASWMALRRACQPPVFRRPALLGSRLRRRAD